MKCKICGQNTQVAFQAKILNAYDENFFKCQSCGFLSVGTNVHWLQEAYTEAINISDTGIIARNLYLHKIVVCIAYLLFGFRNHGKNNIGGGGGRAKFARSWRRQWNARETFTR